MFCCCCCSRLTLHKVRPCVCVCISPLSPLSFWLPLLDVAPSPACLVVVASIPCVCERCYLSNPAPFRLHPLPFPPCCSVCCCLCRGPSPTMVAALCLPCLASRSSLCCCCCCMVVVALVISWIPFFLSWWNAHNHVSLISDACVFSRALCLQFGVVVVVQHRHSGMEDHHCMVHQLASE